MCERSLAYYAKRAWHVLEPSTDLKWGWALDAICLHLEAVTDGRINRLCINVPPGTMKSLLVGVIWPSWEWGPRGMPEKRFIGTAHEENLAIRDSRKCRELIKSDWYQERWPVELLRSLDGKREFGNTATGTRQARAFTSMTGVRGDRVTVDDPISAFNADSESHLEAAELVFRETLPTRVNGSDSAIVVVMQRLHEKDVTGVIKKLGLPYVFLTIPMMFEAANRCTTEIGWTDPRTVEGELMFPERFSEEDVRQLQVALGSYGAAGQLQQRPGPRGGGLFQDAFWRYWRELPPLEYRMIYADTAQKAKQENDFSVLQCWGKGLDGNAYLIDQIRGKWTAPVLLKRAKAFWAKHAARTDLALGVLRRMAIEDKVSGTTLIQTLPTEDPPIPVRAIQRSTDKVSRANDAVPSIEAGRVFLPEDAPWLDDYLSELGAFPKGANDDQVDATCDAVVDLVALGKRRKRIRSL